MPSVAFFIYLNTQQGPMLSTFTDIFTDFFSAQRLFISVDYPVIGIFNLGIFESRKLYKKLVVGNISPW